MFGWPKTEFKSIELLEEYVWEVLENRYVQKKYPIARDIVDGKQKFWVGNGAGHRRAATIRYQEYIKITFPRKTRCKWMVLHEIAHVLTPEEFSAHGREFCRTYLHLIKLFFGEETQNKLKAAMKKHKCKYSKSHTRWKGPIPQEEKDKMLARLIAGRNS